ncbi:universal stress protein [Pseudonocardia hydrocarbonoxydans]|uniref:Universal stress protein n=1 Tax=Pseudonocardia hydrocarbonoxydans TaxID=76726 RepID=A0A4Y3WMK9_9PSEU|nr:universal stress protein [Pseudonocardia hydrocarbonoxydans]GEC20035.1 universal stress protein [Pseudonocardia hydrocarbonoxydans]
MTRDLVVVGLRDCVGGRAALRFALRDAVRRGARVDVVAAFGPADDPASGARAPQRPVGEVAAAVRAAATGMVEDALAEMAGDDPPPVTVLAVAGDAGEVLVHTARTADLLVVGSRGRGRVASAVLGSVSMHCVLHAACPVTVVRPVAEPAPA